MNVIEIKTNKHPIAFCFIDNIHQYKSAWTQELIKNLSDYTLSNLFLKNYDIFQSQDEDSALKLVAEQGYKHAVVFSTGTEFVNGMSFFNEIEKLTKTDYAIYGHILDRKNAFYELHHQCYLINLEIYKKLNYPLVGRTELNSSHNQTIPNRSSENIHDDYTPYWISLGNEKQNYDHKLHGWNIISKFIDHGYKILAFDQNIRNNKKHYYPESQHDFLKHISWAYARYNYCATEFVHLNNTEEINLKKTYKQIITPASGDWFLKYIDKDNLSNVVLYDYNQKSLDYWQNVLPKLQNVNYKFVKIDLLNQPDYHLLTENKEEDTLLNLSNIFCYEGTAMFSSLEYRLKKELEIINSVPSNWTLTFTGRSASGFTDNFNNLKINNLRKPTWHFGADWDE
jgi:hypothetical protein